MVRLLLRLPGLAHSSRRHPRGLPYPAYRSQRLGSSSVSSPTQFHPVVLRPHQVFVVLLSSIRSFYCNSSISLSSCLIHCVWFSPQKLARESGLPCLNRKSSASVGTKIKFQNSPMSCNSGNHSQLRRVNIEVRDDLGVPFER